MANILHSITRSIPNGPVKEALRSSYIQLTTFPIGSELVHIGPSHDKIQVRLTKLPLQKLRLGEREIEGYLQYYRPQPGHVVVNAGAYHGIFAMYLSKKIGPKGRVICFEPERSNRRILKNNLRLNEIKNVTVIPQGLWSKPTRLQFSTRGSSSRIVSNSDPRNEITVCALDQVLSNLNIKKVDFICSDIEGAEIEAIKGAKQTIQSNPNIQLAIASYHIVDSEKTAPTVEKQFKNLGLYTETGFPQHLTTYGFHKQ